MFLLANASMLDQTLKWKKKLTPENSNPVNMQNPPTGIHLIVEMIAQLALFSTMHLPWRSQRLVRVIQFLLQTNLLENFEFRVLCAK